jgi:hypothetical protein
MLLRNYLTIAWRNLQNRTALINVTGLGPWHGQCVVDFRLVRYHLTDTTHRNHDRRTALCPSVKHPMVIFIRPCRTQWVKWSATTIPTWNNSP